MITTVCCYLPFCISDFTVLDFISPQFSQVFQGSVNLIYFLKEPAFCFMDSLWVLFVCLFVSSSLILALIFIISLWLFWDLLVLVFLGV
jgi:hypothetical protein